MCCAAANGERLSARDSSGEFFREFVEAPARFNAGKTGSPPREPWRGHKTCPAACFVPAESERAATEGSPRGTGREVAFSAKPKKDSRLHPLT